jgi:hypothetical protein
MFYCWCVISVVSLQRVGLKTILFRTHIEAIQEISGDTQIPLGLGNRIPIRSDSYERMEYDLFTFTIC